MSEREEKSGQIEELQRLLLGNSQKKALEDLGECMRDPSERARFISEVLPQALLTAQSRDERLTGALQEPVKHCIHQSVQADAGRFADALYPAMGPAIRKSISETLRQFVQSINQALEYSVSVKGLRWRWEAWRSGVSFAEIVLKNTLVYRVEEIYLIHNDTGLLVEHVAASDVEAVKDQDAVSAMLSAILSFVQDAFSGGEGGELETLEMGQRTLWVIRGPDAMMACAIRGIPPAGLRERLAQVLAETHQAYAEPLAEFCGDRGALVGLPVLLKSALESQAREERKKKPRPWPFILLTLLLAIAAAFAWSHFTKDPLAQVRQKLLNSLEQQQGIVLIAHSRQTDGLHLKLLRDPLAPEVSALAETAGYPLERLVLEQKPFQSLEPDMLMARIRAGWRFPPSVQMQLEDGVLSFSGRADLAWIKRLKEDFIPPGGIHRVNTQDLSEDQDALLAEVLQALKAPDSVEVRLQGHALSLSGVAGRQWIDGLKPALMPLEWLQSCDISELEINEWLRVQELAVGIKQLDLVFGEAVELTQESRQLLDAAIESLQEIQRLSELLGVSPRLQITGYSDGVGNQALNFWLRYQRAAYVKQTLVSADIPADWIRTDIHPKFQPANTVDLARRKVQLSFDLGQAIEPVCR